MIGQTRTLTFVDHQPVYDTLEPITPLTTEQIQQKRRDMDCEVPLLTECLPADVQAEVEALQYNKADKLLSELVLDLHRKPVVRFTDDSEVSLTSIVTRQVLVRRNNT